MSFDIELDSIDIDECDAPLTVQSDKRTVQFYGAHACRNATTEVSRLNNRSFPLIAKPTCSECLHPIKIDCELSFVTGKEP